MMALWLMSWFIANVSYELGGMIDDEWVSYMHYMDGLVQCGAVIKWYIFSQILAIDKFI